MESKKKMIALTCELGKIVDFVQTLGGEFADLRSERHRMKQISLVNGVVEKFTSSILTGVAVRVKVGNAWGLASTSVTTLGSLKEAARTAFKLARTSTAYSKKKLLIPEMRPVTKSLKKRVKIDPEGVSSEEKLKFVSELDRAQKETDKRIASRTSTYLESAKTSELANSFGSELRWEETRTTLAILSVALENGRLEMEANTKGGTVGYELVRETDPNEFAGNTAKEAVEMLSAVKPPAGSMKVVVDPSIAGVLAHEVMGHASEADEVVRARSFLHDAVGKHVGSNLVTMIDDGTLAKANGSIPYDSEGIPSSHTTIIKDGVYQGFLHSLETASALGSKPTGNGRAQDYNRRVWVRMTNTFFKPRDWKLDEMVSDTRNGLLALKEISGMEDPVGGGFQVRARKGYIIRNGEKREFVRSFSLTGKALEILKTVDAVSKDFLLTRGNCGKGEEDYVPVSTGGPYMRADIIIGGG